ncbi:class I SAM-dependent methyltransferase [Candidatus Woesearchaeota archaeon]|nr:class I SAM-dependent methyltransferase [Candidatus Woesearchaeota archaeon]
MYFKNKKVFSKKEIANYYDRCQKYCNLLWADKESRSYHYGYWYKDTKSKKEANLNPYREVMKYLKPKKGDIILDAGCGTGGASIWLSKNTKADFIGITLSDKQLRLAKKYSDKEQVSNKINFYKKDYFNTKFSKDKFDKIFAIESFCYGFPNTENLFREMYRILKKDGKLIIIDGVLLRKPSNKYEEELAQGFLIGWRLNGGYTRDELVIFLKKAGFKDVGFVDKTNNIRKNINKVHLMGKFLYFLLKPLSIFNLVPEIEFENTITMINQKKLVEIGILGHGIFYAKK